MPDYMMIYPTGSNNSNNFRNTPKTRMFWKVISGIVVAAEGRHRITRSCFRFLALLVTAIWVLFGIWFLKIPDIRSRKHTIPATGNFCNFPIMSPPVWIHQRLPVRGTTAD